MMNDNRIKSSISKENINKESEINLNETFYWKLMTKINFFLFHIIFKLFNKYDNIYRLENFLFLIFESNY